MEENPERIQDVVFVPEGDKKAAILRILGFDPTQSKEINQVNFLKKVEEDIAVEKKIGSVKVARSKKVTVKSMTTFMMEKLDFQVKGQNIRFHIDEKLASVLSMIFGNAPPEKYRLINFKNEIRGFTCFSRENKIDHVSTLGDVDIRLIGNPNTNHPDFAQNAFRAIDGTFLINRRLLMYKYQSLITEYPPGYGEFTDPFDPDNQGSFSTQFCRSETGAIPDIQAFVPTFPIPLMWADIIIESYAENQSDSEISLVEKEFFTKPKIYMLSLPARVPVLFSFEPTQNCAIVSFADYMDIKVAEIVQLFQNASKFLYPQLKLSSVYCFIFSKMLLSSNIIEAFTPKMLRKIADENGIICLMNKQEKIYDFFDTKIKEITDKRIEPEHESFPTTDLTNYCVYLVTSEASKVGIEKQIEIFNKIGLEIFDKAAFYVCPQCNYTSAHKVPCPLGQHDKGRIPFLRSGAPPDSKNEDDFVMEEIDPEGNVIVYYECCKKVFRDADIGCGRATNHVMPEDDQSDYEVFSEMSELGKIEDFNFIAIKN